MILANSPRWAALLAGALIGMSALAASAVNINQSSAKALQALKGIGPKTAAAIVDYRQQHGKFGHASELSEVKGLSMKRLARIEQRNDVKLVVK